MMFKLLYKELRLAAHLIYLSLHCWGSGNCTCISLWNGVYFWLSWSVYYLYVWARD